LVTVLVYRKKDSAPCDEAIALLRKLNEDHPFDLVIVDIDAHKSLLKKYANNVPFIKIGPYSLTGELGEQRFLVALNAANDRDRQLNEVGDTKYEKRIQQGRNFSKLDGFSLWVSKSYIWIITFFLAMYVGLPFLAPVFLRNGATLPAQVIYTIYKPLCHQLAFRSWFLYGEQAFYPRELAGIDQILSYEDITDSDTIDVRAAQRFIGNEQIGYKVALCERDIAIYASMLLFSLGFIASGRKIKPLPWYIWLFVGLIPIGFDGVSQLPGLASNLPSWIILRESTPLIRTVTGTLFGFTTAWYLFPLIGESMNETRAIMEEKKVFLSSKQTGFGHD
jgi:uncharacterized membrane protein